MSVALLLSCLLALADPPASSLPAASTPPADAPGQLQPDASEAASSRITRVVVFPNHAEITRELLVEARVGHNRVSFGNLVPSMNPHTLRASTSGDARVTGTELRTAFLEESLTEGIAALDREIQTLQDQRLVEQRAATRLDQQVAFYGSVKERVAGDMQRALTDSQLAVSDWQELLQFVDTGLTGCDEQRAALELRVRALESQLVTRKAERAAFAQRQPKQMKLIDVSFDAASEGPIAVQVHTMVDAAVWKPSYDVHLDRASGEIEVIGYGQIIQWTGEPWEDVELSLAMSRPDFELALPELAPMVASLDAQEMAALAQEVAFVNASAQDQVDKWSQGRFKRRQDRETFRRNLEQLARHSSQTLAQYGLSHAIVEGAMTRLADRFSGVRYELERRATIPFDSSPHKVVAFTARMPARLSYVATPALGNSVMLQGAIVNTSGHPILEGGASLFIDESYVGSSKIDGAAQNEGLSFGFGPDDALIVNRQLVSRTVKGPEAFRQSKVITYEYEIAVENFNDRAVSVEVADQIPISKTAEIQVSFLESSAEPLFDATNGRLLWTLEIEAGALSTIRYAFSVECPVDRDVHWN